MKKSDFVHVNRHSMPGKSNQELHKEIDSGEKTRQLLVSRNLQNGGGKIHKKKLGRVGQKTAVRKEGAEEYHLIATQWNSWWGGGVKTTGQKRKLGLTC